MDTIDDNFSLPVVYEVSSTTLSVVSRGEASSGSPAIGPYQPIVKSNSQPWK